MQFKINEQSVETAHATLLMAYETRTWEYRIDAVKTNTFIGSKPINTKPTDTNLVRTLC